MTKRKKSTKNIEQYDHPNKKRLNNPPVGLVSEDTEPYEDTRKTYEYDPHLDPQLQWAGKAEHTSFEVPTVSLHVHERIDPKTIINTVQKEKTGYKQMSLFESEKMPLREAIEFYKHKEGWSNRMIAGDSLLVMNSLLEKEGMAGKVQMIYIDPPYGIKYGSNFQPFVNKRDVKDRKDEDLTAEPEMIKAFRDTWELGIHSYLTYLRDRLLLAKELLHESGNVFVQISDENVHRVRCLMDEVFGDENFISQVSFKKTVYQETIYLANVFDIILWYGKNKQQAKIRKVFRLRELEEILRSFDLVELKDGSIERVSKFKDLPKDAKLLRASDLTSKGESERGSQPYKFSGTEYKPKAGNHWKTHQDGLDNLSRAKRLIAFGKTLCFKKYANDFPVTPYFNVWEDTVQSTFATENIYVVQTYTKVIQRCLLMTTDPGDLVFDPTCGSGTTAYVAEQWGRRWITCDTSRVALTLAKQRLMTANFDYYQLAHPHEGVGSGFVYKTVPHITLKSIANNEPPKEETLYDQPKVDRKKTRITGPFTVEAVPSLRARSLEEIEKENQGTGESVARSGETLRQTQWRDELLKSGVRAKGGHKLEFTRVEPMSGTRWIQCEAETREDLSAVPAQAGKPQKVFIVLGPEHAPLEQRMVENAWQEARPFKPDILLFCAFQFDDEAAKDIDELKPEIAGMQLLKVQMNADLFTDDLKKKRSGNDSFWLIGQPDVDIRTITKGEDKGKYQVEVLGFDYYNPKTGNVDSGGKGNIAMWLLDTDYDDRSLFPSQVFFPMAGAKDGWSKLARNLKAEIDEEKIEAFKGTVSLPFEKGDNAKIAVKIIDDRGIESLRVVSLPERL
ncbi:MAG: site-specific DNA-methyltransferase [Deltaproteobacteria bacterium]|nr:site-specific DNA-methyltransferase [Deltaproteobacteria bacterium]MBW1966818.1 site-specific DNA-methyltransferase [Deltaproteobacteria bacterium]MBW2097680.1 site-specific DNA-methyltransferase [Deltaproteobacteria bacterium]